MKKYVFFVLSLLLVFFVFQQVDLESFYAEMHVFSNMSLLTVLLLFVVNALIVMLRYWRVLAHFGHVISFIDVIRASASANIASLLMIPLIGQVAGRQAMLNKAGVTATENAAIAAYERFVAGSLSGVLAILGAGYIFSSSLSEYLENIPLIQIFIILIISFSLYAFFVLSRSERFILNSLFSVRSFLNIIEVYLITLLGSAFVLCSFYILFSVVLPDVEKLKILSAAAIVSFLAGLPISFGGWGLREISSIYVITALGGSSASALAASVMQGLISTAAVLLIFPLVFIKSKIAEITPQIKKSFIGNKASIEKLALWILTFLVFSLVFFQVHTKIGEGYLNVNLADPFAILVFSVVMLNFTFKRELPSWMVPHFNMYLLLISLAFVVSYTVGFYTFGKIDWAAGKIVGWLVLLGYLFSGNLVVRNFGFLGYFRFIQLMIVVMTLVLIVSISMWFLHVHSIFSIKGVVGFHYILEAYSGNRNALAFQVLVVLCLGLAIHPWYLKLEKSDNSLKFFICSMCILTAAVFITGSRSAIGSMVLIFIAAWLLNAMDRKLLLKILLIGILIFIISHYVFYFAQLIINFLQMIFNFLIGFLNYVLSFIGVSGFSGASGASGASAKVLTLPISTDSSDASRWLLIVSSFNMWLDNPFFGAGLGVFYKASAELFGYDVVVHNTSLWLLAEFGIIGFIIFLTPFVFILNYAIKDCKNKAFSNALILLLILFAAMSLFHEVFYQRMFWLVLGGLLALPKYNRFSI